MRTSQQFYSLHRLPATILVFLIMGFISVHSAQLANTNYSLQGVEIDKKRDGAVDLKAHLSLTNVSLKSAINIVCNHRTPEPADWLIKFESILFVDHSTNIQIIAQTVADSILFADQWLRKNYPADPLASVYLADTDMPNAFTEGIYLQIAAQLRGLPGRGQKRYADRRLKNIIRTAFRNNEAVQTIRKKLSDAGLDTEVDCPELAAIRMKVEGMKWQDIAQQPQAGLNPEAATVWLEIKRKKKE